METSLVEERTVICMDLQQKSSGGVREDFVPGIIDIRISYPEGPTALKMIKGEGYVLMVMTSEYLTDGGSLRKFGYEVEKKLEISDLGVLTRDALDSVSFRTFIGDSNNKTVKVSASAEHGLLIILSKNPLHSNINPNEILQILQEKETESQRKRLIRDCIGILSHRVEISKTEHAENILKYKS